MRGLLATIVVASTGTSCHFRVPARVVLPPLEDQGEVYVYLEAPPDEARQVSFTVASLAAVGDDGLGVPLMIASSEISWVKERPQRLLAFGRLPVGLYTGLAAKFAKATLTRAGGAADLLVPEAPVTIPLTFRAERARSDLISVSLARAVASDHELAFAPVFAAFEPRLAGRLTAVNGYCTSDTLASLSVFDKHRHEVVGVIPTGREPQGLAIDANERRLYVALPGQDQVQVFDLSTGEELRRVSLQPGDRPGELALTPDGRLLITANRGSNTATFIDPFSGLTLDQVPTGDEPASLLMDRGARRAYVFNRRSSDITVLDLATRQVVATVRTDAEPLRGQLNRAGTRLYVIHRGSQYLAVYAVPELTPVTRLYVGLGASALKVDPKSDLLYVGRADEDRVQAYDPYSFVPIDSIEVPGPVSYLTIDDVENALVSVIPSRRTVAFTDLTSRRLLSEVELAAEPFHVVLEAERY